ncbi:hypothetical protein RB595_002304, partial [Gaeumannomyces hyphopodioides]
MLRGSPGAGKSTLMLEAYTKTRTTNPNSAVASFFFSAKAGEAGTSLLSLYKSLLYQLLPYYPETGRYLIGRLKERKAFEDARHWTELELKAFLRDMLVNERRDQKTLIFVDGLDECTADVQSQVSYWRGITSEACKSGGQLSVCISTKSFPHVTVRNCLEIEIEKYNGNDIIRYVDQKLGDIFLEGYGETDLARIREELLRRFNGIFLWVVLVMESLLEKHNRGDPPDLLLEQICAVPKELEATFSQMLQGFDQSTRATALKLFSWALLPTKSLRLHEWHHILAFIGDFPPISLRQWRDSNRFIGSRSEVRGFNGPWEKGTTRKTENYNLLEKQIKWLSRGLLTVATRSTDLDGGQPAPAASRTGSPRPDLSVQDDTSASA